MKPNSTPRLVPLNNLQSEIVESNLVLPGAIGLEQLGIDIIRLETLCKIAGIRKLTIRNKKSESEGTTITGRNRDGTAIGGIVNTKAMSTSSQKRVGAFKPIMHAETGIEIDVDELMRTILENFPEGVRSLEGWSQELEEIITKHVGNEGLKFLLSAELGAAKLDTLCIIPGLILSVSYPKYIASTVIFLILTRLAGYMGGLQLAKEARFDDMYMRISPLSIAGIEWDRALVLIVMIANTRNLIGKINQDSD